MALVHIVKMANGTEKVVVENGSGHLTVVLATEVSKNLILTVEP